MNLFIVHPVISDGPELGMLISWRRPGKWFIEVHDPPLEQQMEYLRVRIQGRTAPRTSKVWLLKDR